MNEMMVVKRQETRDLRPRGDTGGRNGERARGEANRSTRDRLHLNPILHIFDIHSHW